MKTRYTFLLGILFFFSLSANAQMHRRNRQDFKKNRQKIESLKIAYLTEKLMLTTEEAQRFWPVYNKYKELKNSESKKFRDNCSFNRIDVDSINKLSDKEASSLADGAIIHSQKMLDINKLYHKELKSVLPVKKVLMFYKFEREFKRWLLEEMRDNRKRKNMPK